MNSPLQTHDKTEERLTPSRAAVVILWILCCGSFVAGAAVASAVVIDTDYFFMVGNVLAITYILCALALPWVRTGYKKTAWAHFGLIAVHVGGGLIHTIFGPFQSILSFGRSLKGPGLGFFLHVVEHCVNRWDRFVILAAVGLLITMARDIRGKRSRPWLPFLLMLIPPIHSSVRWIYLALTDTSFMMEQVFPVLRSIISRPTLLYAFACFTLATNLLLALRSLKAAR